MRNISYIEDFKTWKNEFSFYTDIKVRFSETDMFGHVNNVSPFIYFEQARIEYLSSLGVFTLEPNPKYVPVVADLQCDYIAQLYFGDTLRLYVKANSVGNSSIDIHYLGINQNEKVCIIGRGRLVNIDAKSGKSAPFTEEMRKKLIQ